MLRRLTAALTMLALTGLLGMLIWEVQQHSRHSFMGAPAKVVNFALGPALIT